MKQAVIQAWECITKKECNNVISCQLNVVCTIKS